MMIELYDQKISALSLAEIAGITPETLKRNFYMLLRMAIKNGCSIKKDFAERMDKLIIAQNLLGKKNEARF